MMSLEISFPRSRSVCRSNPPPNVVLLKTTRSNITCDCRSSFFNHLSSRSSSEDINFLWQHFSYAQTTRLSPTIAKNNVCFLILDVPWFNDKQVAGTHPSLALHLSRDTSHPRFFILADNM